MFNTNRFMGYQINTESSLSLIRRVTQSIYTQDNFRYNFACANPHSLAIAEYRPEFRRALQLSDILVTDGVGLSVAGKIFSSNVGPRITGGEFFSSLMNELNKHSHLKLGRKARVFFFGSSPKVLELIYAKSQRVYPNIEICGMISPPFGDWSTEQNQGFIREINAAEPDVIWVGMTAPKQEIWCANNRKQLNAPIIGSIGAVFDFFAGTFERAPEWASKGGIEWLFRLCKEPRRMWRRNFLSPFIFLTAAYLHNRYERDTRSASVTGHQKTDSNKHALL